MDDITLFRTIAEQTKTGQIQWSCAEYNPLEFMNEDRIDDEPAYLSQMLTFAASVNGISYTLELFEKINIPEGKGDIAVTLIQDDADSSMQFDTALSFRYDEYEACSADQLAEVFRDDPAVILSNSLVPLAVDSNAVQQAFLWARFFNEDDIPETLLTHPITRLGVRLFNERRILDFHRCILDMPYQNNLLAEPDDQDEPVGNSAYELVHWINTELRKCREELPQELVEKVAQKNNISEEDARIVLSTDLMFDDLVKEAGQASAEFAEMDTSDPAELRKILKKISEAE